MLIRIDSTDRDTNLWQKDVHQSQCWHNTPYSFCSKIWTKNTPTEEYEHKHSKNWKENDPVAIFIFEAGAWDNL